MRAWSLFPVPLLLVLAACGTDTPADLDAPPCPVQDCGPPAVRAAVPTRATALIGFAHPPGAERDPTRSSGYRWLSRVSDVIDLQLDDVFYGLEKCLVVAPELDTTDVTQWRPDGDDKLQRLRAIGQWRSMGPGCHRERGRLPFRAAC